MSKLEIHYADEWAALYIDGQLERVGDAYLTEERAFEILGVTVIHDDAFMKGQTQADGVAKSLREVSEYAQRRNNAREEAARLREEAARLTEQAARLEGSSTG